MEISFTRLLEKDEGVALRSYLQLINEIKELDTIDQLESKE